MNVLVYFGVFVFDCDRFYVFGIELLVFWISDLIWFWSCWLVFMFVVVCFVFDFTLWLVGCRLLLIYLCFCGFDYGSLVDFVDWLMLVWLLVVIRLLVVCLLVCCIWLLRYLVWFVNVYVVVFILVAVLVLIVFAVCLLVMVVLIECLFLF